MIVAALVVCQTLMQSTIASAYGVATVFATPLALLIVAATAMFASGLAVLLMLGVSVYIAVEAIGRIGDTAKIAFGPMLIVGGIGLIVNIIALLLLAILAHS